MSDPAAGDETGVSYAGLVTDPRMVAVLSLTFLGITGIQTMPPVLPAISSELGVSDARIGLVMTAFFLPAALALPFVGLVADLYGRRRLALGSIALFGLSGTAVYFVETYTAVLVLRSLQGLAFPGLIPLSITLIGDLYSGPAGTTAQGFRLSVNGIGSTLSPLVAGALAGIAWNVPFLVFVVAVPAFVVVYAWLPETAAPADRSPGGGTAGGYARAVLAELRDRDLAILILGAFATFFGQVGVLTFIPLFAVRELGVSSALGGSLIAVFGGTRVLLSPVAGSLVLRWSRKTVIVAATKLAGLSAVALVAVGGFWTLVVLVFGVAAGLSLFTPVVNDAITTMASDERRAGVVNVMEIAKTGANAISPAFFGLVLAAAGFAAVFAVAAGVFVAFAAVALAFFRR